MNEELERLLSIERAALTARSPMQSLTLIYQSLGGNLANARRVVQIHADMEFQENFDKLDLSGIPEGLEKYLKDLAKPKIQLYVVESVGRTFDKLLGTI